MNALETKQAALKKAGRTPVQAAQAVVEWLREQQVTGTLLTEAEARVAALKKGETS